MSDILILAALREEIAKMRPMDGVVVATTGDGPLRAGHGAAAAIDRLHPRCVIGIGIAGAISTDLNRGDLVAGQTIVDENGSRHGSDPALVEAAIALGAKPGTLVTSRGIASAEAKRQLAQSIQGTCAVDLESASWRRAAAARGVPFVAVRSIVDTAAEDLPAIVLQSIRPDGSISRGWVVARAIIQPAQIPLLFDLRRRTAEAVTVLTRFTVALVKTIRSRG